MLSQAVIESIKNRRWLETKPKRVATTRWGSWHDAMEKLLGFYHEKALVVCSVGVLQGWIKNESRMKSFLDGLREKDVAEFKQKPEEKDSTKDSARKVQELREEGRKGTG